MDKKTGIIIAVLVAGFIGLVGISMVQSQQPSYNYDSYDISTVMVAEPANGGFGDIIEGSPDAPIKVFEYGNYQCTACAGLNEKVNMLVQDYDGKVAIVFRSMSLPDHDNGTASAAAALAAAKQGYWQAYKDLLYKNQSEWYYATGTDRQTMFEAYFLTVTSGQGDLEQFRSDMKSKEVAQKIAFDEKMAQKADAAWSPYFILDGEVMPTSGAVEALREKIEAKLAE